jgi:hypothetical protein
MSKKLYILGGVLLMFGFAWEGFRGFERPISKELMDFISKEQMTGLKNFLKKWVDRH